MESVIAWIREHQLSREEFGERIGVQRSYVSKVLNGRNKPSLEVLRKIYHVTSIPLEKLLDEAIGDT